MPEYINPKEVLQILERVNRKGILALHPQELLRIVKELADAHNEIAKLKEELKALKGGE